MHQNEHEDQAEIVRAQVAGSLLNMLANVYNCMCGCILLWQAVNSKCFNQCIKKPGVKLERADEVHQEVMLLSHQIL